MSKSKKELVTSQRITVTEGVIVSVIPDQEYEYLMTTKEVAFGYGTSKYSIFKTLDRHVDDFVEGKHFVKGVYNMSTPGIQPNAILWTKAGIVRLGFFLTCLRAKLFRDIAENLILNGCENCKQTDLFGNVEPAKKLPAKRKHNRLTPERLVEALSLAAYISDEEKRLRMVNILTGGTNYGTI